MFPKEVSTWQQDLIDKQEFSEFLDKYVYNPISETVIYRDGSCPVFQRVTDVGLQLQGISVILNESRSSLRINEKSQLNNINQNIPTFALELSYMKNGTVEAGWLLDPRKKTDAYMFSWPFCDEGFAAAGIKFSGAEMLLVSKTKIIGILSQYGYDRETLADRDERIRTTGKYGRYRSTNPDFWFNLSKKGPEHPINIVMRVELLKKIALASLSVEKIHGGGYKLSGKWGGLDIDVDMDNDSKVLGAYIS